MGFEPMMQITPHNTLAGCRLQPTRPLLLFTLVVMAFLIQPYMLILPQKIFFENL